MWFVIVHVVVVVVVSFVCVVSGSVKDIVVKSVLGFSDSVDNIGNGVQEEVLKYEWLSVCCLVEMLNVD